MVAPKIRSNALDETAILLAAGVHAEALQHLGGSTEPNELALLSNRKRSQEYRYQPVLAKGHTELWMAGDLEDEVPVTMLVKELVFRQAPDGQAAEDKWARAEAQFLGPLLALEADQFDALDPLQFLLGDQKITVELLEEITDRLELSLA
jgi:hypothetical protein